MHGLGSYSLGIAVSSSWLAQHGSSQHHAVHEEEYSRLVPLDLAVRRCQLLVEHSHMGAWDLTSRLRQPRSFGRAEGERGTDLGP